MVLKTQKTKRNEERKIEKMEFACFIEKKEKIIKSIQFCLLVLFGSFTFKTEVKIIFFFAFSIIFSFGRHIWYGAKLWLPRTKKEEEEEEIYIICS